MIESVEEYVDELKRELAGSDRALIQDAVADAREHLSGALESVLGTNPRASEREELQTVIAAFGTPAEIATAYREIELRVPVGLGDEAVLGPKRGRFFAVYRDSRTWSTTLYMALSFVLGTGYLIWVCLGLAFSVLFSITIIGLPIVLAYVMSVRGIALLEGRLIETLLGVRMPRRRTSDPRAAKRIDRLRAIARDKQTWFALLYAAGLWLVGSFYISLLIGALGISGALLVAPFYQEALGRSLLIMGSEQVLVPRWAYIVSILAGVALWTTFLHLARAIGALHGKLAKALLVDEVSA